MFCLSLFMHCRLFKNIINKISVAAKEYFDAQQSCSHSHNSHRAPSSPLSNTCPLLADSSLLHLRKYMCTRTHSHKNTATLDAISHTDDFKAGKITEHICCSSIIIMNWTVANFHYRLSFRSICNPPMCLHLTHGVIYTFMTLKHVPVYSTTERQRDGEGLLPCLQSDSLKFTLCKATLDPPAVWDFLHGGGPVK